MRNRFFALAISAICLAWSADAPAQDKAASVVKLGVLTDLSGPLSTATGRGSVIAAQLAVQDFNGQVNGRRIELLSADHQNKADIGAGIARKWFDADGVDAIIDVPNSVVGLAVVEVGRQANRTLLLASPSASDITGRACSANAVHWGENSYEVAHGGPMAIYKQGGDSWFFVVVDNAFGNATMRETAAVIEGAGGKVVGSVKHPANAGDYSSYLLQAQSSRAKVLGISSAGDDMSNVIKQATEFGITTAGGQKIALLSPATLNVVHNLGLKVAQNLYVTESSYWDLNDKTRSFATRFQKLAGVMPSTQQLDVYGVVSHYLKSIQGTRVDLKNGTEVVKLMRARPGDSFGSPVTIRVDGFAARDLYLFQVKTPAESKGEWDLYKLATVIPAAEAVHPLSKDCALVGR